MDEESKSRRQSLSSTRENDELQGEWPNLLPGRLCTRSPIGSVRGSGRLQSPRDVESFALGISKKPDTRCEKGLRGFRAVASMSVLSKWYTSVLVGPLAD